MPLPPKGRFVGPEVDAIFVANVSQIIADFGRPVIIHRKPLIEDCPNCGWNNVRKASNGVYNTSNTNPEPGPRNIPFARGSVCPVCRGVGKLNTPRSDTIIAAVLTTQQELRELEKLHSKRINSLVETIS